MKAAEVTETIEIVRPLPEVYGAFADLRRWKDILSDVLDVRTPYDDGYNQEFTMTVERPGGAETVRGFRFCRAPREVEMVQTTPPPGLSRMVGHWSFEAVPGGTLVTARRSFALSVGAAAPTDPVAATEEFGVKLTGFLRANLISFQRALENHAAA